MAKLFEELLRKRGVDETFLNPKYGGFGRLPDIQLASERICRAVDRGEKILIYGDYDVDGVTASAIMLQILLLIGLPRERVKVVLPDRFRDGYGMNERIIGVAKEFGAKLVITVDCGSSNGDIIEKLSEQGVETVVTDHHAILDDLPPAVAVVNAQRSDFVGAEDLRQLSGAGVAFMLALEMVKMGRIPDGQEKWLLDLAAIGTICDAMILTGVNRVICYYGLIVLSKTRRVGLVELLRTSGVKLPITTEAVGFQIGPRLNAAGRMKTAEIAFKLLTTTSRAEAVRLATELEELNAERKKQQNMAIKEVKVGTEPVIFAKGKWHEGILGIIAGRLVEQYHRPAFALSEVEPGVYKGSGRSFGDFSLAQALSECQKCLEKCGGHSGACGLTVLKENLPKFEAAVLKFYQGLDLKNQEDFFEVSEDLAVSDLGEFDAELVKDLKKLEPYGEGNPEPVWLLPDVLVLNVRTMGAEGQHLRMSVRGEKGGSIGLVAFYAKDEWTKIQEGERLDVFMTLTENEWQGAKSVEGRIVQIRRK